MSEKIHQSSHSQYQIRIDGVPKYYPHAMGSDALETWAALCKKNPDCYVDIVRVDTQIIMSQYDYHQMQTHFNKSHNDLSTVEGREQQVIDNLPDEFKR